MQGLVHPGEERRNSSVDYGNMNWSKRQLSCNRMGLKERLGRSWWKDDGIWCENDHLNAFLFIPSCCVLVKRHAFVYLKAGWKRARWMELLVRYVFILSQINYVHFNRLYAYVSHFFLIIQLWYWGTTFCRNVPFSVCSNKYSINIWLSFRYSGSAYWK